MDEEEKRDFYEKEPDPAFAPPCDTCIHRHKKIGEEGCPCLKCTNYGL